jgi:predicted acyl esterase
MPNKIRNLHTVDEHSFQLIYEQNVDVDIGEKSGPVRCNVYRPKGEGKYPVLVTYGPYGKDVPYNE